MDDKNVEKDVRNKSNMLVSLYLKHAEHNIHKLY